VANMDASKEPARQKERARQTRNPGKAHQNVGDGAQADPAAADQSIEEQESKDKRTPGKVACIPKTRRWIAGTDSIMDLPRILGSVAGEVRMCQGAQKQIEHDAPDRWIDLAHRACERRFSGDVSSDRHRTSRRSMS
jgi:hypothetical protein